MDTTKRRSPVPSGLGEHGKKFWANVLRDWTFSDYEKQILLGACRALDVYHRCLDVIEKEGTLAVSTRGLKARPEVGLQKTCWQNFLQACKALGIPQIEEPEKKSVGRPPGDPRQYKEYWQKRGGYG